MNQPSANTSERREQLAKSPTGIEGLDEITLGGLPEGRPTLICGGAGCGKTLLAMEFLIRGATQFGEPGVFLAFEETAEDLAENVRSLGFDLNDLIAQKKLVVDYIRVERSEIEEAGEYDLEGLFVRLGYAIDSIGAKRVVLDTLETLFGGLANDGILRSELRRLFRWIKDRGVTAIITAERGEGKLTRQGLEEYVSDCVILLDHRVIDQISTRRLRVVKYRGTTHGTNEYPFLIDQDGISVLPVTSLGLRHKVSEERISTGIARLDTMLAGSGYYRGSTVLVTGTAGCGKTSVASSFVNAACERGERCLFFTFEESPGQLIRNMRSIGIDLQRSLDAGLLRFEASRVSDHGLEMHLATVHKLVRVFDPQVVVIDPVSGLMDAGTKRDATIMLTRLIDFLKAKNVTSLLTNLTSSGEAIETSGVDISSLVDTWALLRDIEYEGERNRVLHLLKARGMAHSNQVREFLLTNQGIELQDVYVGPRGVVTGSARRLLEDREQESAQVRLASIEAKKRERQRRLEAFNARVEALQKEFAADQEDSERQINEVTALARFDLFEREAMRVSRQADASRSILDGSPPPNP